MIETDLNGFIAMFTRTPVEGYIGTGMAIRDADFRDKACKISVPTICVVGDQDGATPRSGARHRRNDSRGKFCCQGSRHIPAPNSLLLLSKSFEG